MKKNYNINSETEIYMYLSSFIEKERLNLARPLDRDVFINRKNYLKLAANNLKRYPSVMFMTKVKVRSLFDEFPSKR